MEQHHPIMDKLGDLGGRTYRQTDIPKFIQCVDGLEPQIPEFWTFGEDCVTPEAHPTARVDVITEFVGAFVTNYLTPIWRRIPILE